MKLAGTVLLILCGAGLGLYLSEAYRGRTETLADTAEMLLSLSIMLEYGAPTVDEMLSGLAEECGSLPRFMKNVPDRASLTDRLKDPRCGLGKADAARLAEFFTQLGSADRLSEQKRISSARAYFLQRTEQERPKNARRAELSRKLGILGGIFAAIMLL